MKATEVSLLAALPGHFHRPASGEEHVTLPRAGTIANVPGVRTTIAAAGGIPGNSLVEIDCIACI